MHVKEQKYYADTAGTRTRQQRVRIHPEFTALTVDRATGQFESMRTLAPPVGQRLGVPHRRRLGLATASWPRSPSCCARRRRRRRSRPAATTSSSTRPTCSSPSTSRSGTPPSWTGRSATRPPTPARRSPPSTSSARLQYGSPLMNVTGDRTAVARAVDRRLGRRGRRRAAVGHREGRRPRRVPGRPQHGPAARACRAPTAARSPTRPSHVPVQRMANVSLQPAPDGPSTEEIIGGVERGIYVVGDKSWSIDMQRYNFQFTGQRFYRIENGRLAGQLRDVAYQATTTDFWGSMAVVGGPQTYVLGGAFNCGKAQPGQVAPVSHGCPTALFENVEHPQHRPGGRAMSALHRRRSSSSARWPPPPPTGRSPSSPSSSEANLRWAANSLTTNGAMRSRHVVVVSFVDGGAGMAAGTVARTGTPDVADAGRGERAGRPGRRAGRGRGAAGRARRPPGTGDWDADPAETSIEVFARLRAGPGPGVRRGARPRRAAVRLRRALDARRRTSAPRPGCGCGTTSRPAGSSSTARAPTSRRSVWAGVGTRDFRDVSVADARRRRRAARWAGRSGGSSCRPGRYETLLPPSAVSDLMIYLYWTMEARDADEGRNVFARPGGGNRIGERLADAAADAAQRPGAPRDWRRRPFQVVARVVGRRRRSSTTAWPRRRSNWIDGRRADQPDPAAGLGAADDGAGHGRRRQPDPRGPDRDRVARTRWSPPPSAGCC